MSPGPHFREAAFAPTTEEAFICLLTIKHESLSEDLRFCNNGVSVIRNKKEYLPLPFTLTLPDDSEESPPTACIVMDNVSRELVASLHGITKAPTVDIALVSSRDWDVVEAHWDNFEMRQITDDAFTMKADLFLESLDREPWPAGTYTPAMFRGMF